MLRVCLFYYFIVGKRSTWLDYLSNTDRKLFCLHQELRFDSRIGWVHFCVVYISAFVYRLVSQDMCSNAISAKWSTTPLMGLLFSITQFSDFPFMGFVPSGVKIHSCQRKWGNFGFLRFKCFSVQSLLLRYNFKSYGDLRKFSLET